MTLEHEIIDGVCVLHKAPAALCFEMMQLKATVNVLRDRVALLSAVEKMEKDGADPAIVRLGRLLGGPPSPDKGHVVRAGGMVVVVLIKKEKSSCEECSRGVHAECPKYQGLLDFALPSGCCCFADHFEARELR